MRTETTKDVLVLGLGNLLLCDEGVGVHVVRQLQRGPVPEGVECVDGGTGGFELMNYVRGKKKVVIVDCLNAEGSPGTVVRLTPDDVARSTVARYSVHQGGLEELLRAIKGMTPAPEVVIFGVVPSNRSSPDTELSNDVKVHVQTIVGLVRKELRASAA